MISNLSSSLPLRLAVEPIAKKIFGNCFVLPSNHEDKLCIIITNFNNYNDTSDTLFNLNNHNNCNVGLIAITVNTVDAIQSISSILGLDCKDLTFFVYVYKTDQWYDKGGSQLLSTPPTKEKIISSIQSTIASNGSYPILLKKAQMIVHGIQRYYARQVLEPSIRGFLSILEKTFPRNDLYLFELLQNAVDDGAMHVCFHVKCFDRIKQNSRFEVNEKDVEGLFFTHNGRRFNALDCLGLASVGLSTKGSESNGQKRTIGFMGVGFKAVYKRFAKVTIYDDVWAFTFEEPSKPAPMEPSHGWVLKPRWIENKAILWDNDSKSKSANWCHFQLERPRVSGVSKDLSQLPSSIPALLGRQALENESRRVESKVQIDATGKWTLEWGNSIYSVSRHASGKSLNFTDPITIKQHWSGGSECIIVQTDSRSSNSLRRWQFISLYFLPDSAAQAAYSTHTKRNWGDGTSLSREETCFFFEVSEDGSPLGSRGPRGSIHAVLPTKLKLNSAVQWQASWLLSVDRQDVQNVGDNEWNSSLLKQAPRLFSCLLMWSANTNPSDVKAVFELLPILEIEINEINRKKVSTLTSSILGQKIVMDELVHITLTEKVVPVLKNFEDKLEVCYSRGKDVVWLPPPLLNMLPLNLLQTWFSGDIIASTKLGDLMWSPLWKQTLNLVSVNMLSCRYQYFSQTYERNGHDDLQKVLLQLHIMAALVQCTSMEASTTTATETLATTKTNLKALNVVEKDKEPDTICSDWLPQIRHWPVFLTSDKRTVLSANEILWLDSDFMSLTPDIRALLRPAILLAYQAREKEIYAQSGQRRTTTSSTGYSLLDTSVEEALMNATATGTDPIVLSDAKKCAQIIRDSIPNRVINVESAARFYLEALSKRPDSIVSESEVVDILNLFSYAVRNSKPSLVSFLLVEDRDASSKGVKNHRLLQAEKTYIGSAYNSDALDLDNLCRDVPRSTLMINFTSPVYLKHLDTVKTSTLCHFLEKCGAQRGLSLAGFTRQVTKVEVSSSLSGALPPLRSSTPSCQISLPYGLGYLLRNHHTVVDAKFTIEWKRLLSLIGSDISKATLFSKLVAQLFENLDSAPIATPDSTPAAAAALKGQPALPSVVNTGVIPQDSPLPVLARLYHLPPGQPGAKAISIGATEWMMDLASTKWVPATMGEVSPDSPPTMVLSPAEVILPRAEDRFSGSSEMPTARLPPQVLKTFLHASSAVMSILNWGTVKPKPPLERLEKLIRNVLTDSSENDVSAYEELVYIWRSLGLAHRENRLQLADQRKVRLLLDEARNKRIIPAYGQLWELDRCVYVINPNYDVNLSEEELALICLCRAGYLFDMSSNHNDASRKYEKNEWALAHVSDALKALLQPATKANKNIATNFLKWTCRSEQLQLSPATRKGFSYATWIIIKDTVGEVSNDFFSTFAKASGLKALKQAVPDLRLLCHRGPGQGPNAFPSRWLPAFSDQSSLDNVRPVLIDDGTGATTFGSGIVRSSLLVPEHLLQPLGLYNHGYENYSSQHLFYEQDRSLNADLKKVEIIDRKILSLLGIYRTSDPKTFILKVATGGTPEYLPEASKRIELIMHVIWDLMNLDISAPPSNQQIEVKLPPISLYRHSTISIQFKTPTMSKPSIKQVFAVWGASSSSAVSSLPTDNDSTNSPDDAAFKRMYGKGLSLLSKFGYSSNENTDDSSSKLIQAVPRKCPRAGLGMPSNIPMKRKEKLQVNKSSMKNILIAGDPDDYGHELEELIYSIILTNLPLMGKADKRPVKALRLLQYICDENKFKKHFKRDFEMFLQQDGRILDMFKDLDEVTESSNNNIDEDYDDLLNYTTALRTIDSSKEDGEVMEPPVKRAAIEKETKLSNVTAGAPVNLVKDRLAEKGMSNLPAWMTALTTSSTITNDDSVASIIGDNPTSKEMIIESTPIIQSLPSPADEVTDGGGKGNLVKDRLKEKGMSNLPSWMTAPTSSSLSESKIEPSVSETNQADLSLSSSIAIPPENLIKDRLSGKGLSNLPAWLTLPQNENVTVEELIVENTTAANNFLQDLLPTANTNNNNKRQREDDFDDKKDDKKSSISMLINNSEDNNIDSYISSIDEIINFLKNHQKTKTSLGTNNKITFLMVQLGELKNLLSQS